MRTFVGVASSNLDRSASQSAETEDSRISPGQQPGNGAIPRDFGIGAGGILARGDAFGPPIWPKLPRVSKGEVGGTKLPAEERLLMAATVDLFFTLGAGKQTLAIARSLCLLSTLSVAEIRH